MNAMNRCRPIAFAVVIYFVSVWSNAHSNDVRGNKLFDTQIPQFVCTNLSVSEAIMSMAGNCTFPINSIIDTTEEPRVTLSLRQQDCASVLREIIRPLHDYDLMVKSGAILVCPQRIAHSTAFPLNRPLPEFTVEFLSSGSQTNTSYGCQFDWQAASSLNVALPFLPLKFTKPRCDSFPCVRRYKDRTLVDVLMELSVECIIRGHVGGSTLLTSRRRPLSGRRMAIRRTGRTRRCLSTR